MTVFGICMAKNEEDIIGPVVEHMMSEVDHVIVADNLSQDNTRSILDSLTGNITVIDDLEPAYRQSEKMTHLAMVAKKEGAKWVVPFDADEWWRSPHGRLANVIRDSNFTINIAPLYDHVPTSRDSAEPNPIKRMCWRKLTPTSLHKVACKTSWDLTIHMGNHNASYLNHEPTYDGWDLIEVRHFPIRTIDQVIQKARTGAQALKLTDLPYDVGKHWRDWDNLSDDQFREAWSLHWFEQDPSQNPELVYDPV